MRLKERLALWIARREVRQQVERWIGRPFTRREKSMLKNWKTTVLGWLAGITGGSVIGWTKPDGGINWGAVALSVLIAALGSLAKDHNISGTGQ